MLAALLFHGGNQDQAVSLCKRIARTGGVEKHRILLATDGGSFEEMDAILKGVFSEVLHCRAHEEPNGWPARENALHANVVRHVRYVLKCPWLRIEPDSIPVKSTWLDEIETAYNACGKRVLAGTSNHPQRFCGVAVFPFDASECSLEMMRPKSVWYADGWRELMRQSSTTDLMSETPTKSTVIHVRAADASVGGEDRTCIVQLGRMGDVLNILPLVKRINDTEGKPVLMVHKDYAGIDVDYCDLDVWEGGAWSDLSLAVRDARNKYKRVLVSQIHGDRWQTDRKCSSFCIESWRMAGYEGEFGKWPLVLESKSELAQEIQPGTILVNCNGTSSPFPYGNELLDLARSTGHPVVDLAGIRAEKIQDLLALYGKAGLLITIDTATLHLAEASNVPVIALVADGHTPWLSSSQKGNEVLRMRYREFPKNRQRIIDAIEVALSRKRRVYHIYQDFDCDGDTKRRNDFAKTTWAYPDFVTGHPVGKVGRDSSTAGDTRGLCFIKDILSSVDAEPDDALVFTNTDTCLRKGFWWEMVGLSKPMHGHRYDFGKLERPLDVAEIPTGKWYPGSDVFAFTKGWWDEHQKDFPDMLVGAEAWDKIMRTMVKHHGGEEIFTSAYHEAHEPRWLAMRANDAANRHNRILAKQWLRGHGYPLEELAQFDDAPVDVAPTKREKRKNGRSAKSRRPTK